LIAFKYRCLPLLLLLLGVHGATAQGDEPLLLTEDSGALLDLDGETRLVIEGLQGTIGVRAGLQGEIRYEARTRDNTREPRIVGLWVDGRTLRIGPVEGDDGAKTLIEVTVPPAFDVEVIAADSLVKSSALSGGFRVGGTKVDLSARGMKGTIDVDVQGGKIFVSGTEEALTIEGRALNVVVEYARAPVYLSVAESVIDLTASRDATEGEIAKTTLDAVGLEGPMNLTATESKVSLERVTCDGTLDLEQTPLVLSQTTGSLEVRTDAIVEFTGHDGRLKIEGYGSAVRGNGGEGVVEIETDGAEVRLDQIAGQIQVRGQDLDLQMSSCNGDASVETTGARIAVKKAGGALVLKNEFGDIEVSEAAGAVEVASRDGDVFLNGLKAPLKLKAEGGEVEVGWVSMAEPQDCTIEGSGGDVRVRLPGAANVRLEAEARHGQIESDLPGIEVSGDGHSASGIVGRGRGSPQAKRPTVRVRSGGDLYLSHRQ
jgi:DUF4097 and DUF4098 domain-containing protein YvlB